MNSGVQAFQQVLSKIKDRMKDIRYKVAVISGKGGVGKSFIAVSLALALASQRRSVGLLDADIHGPSISWLLKVKEPPSAISKDLIKPAIGPLGIKVLSAQFLLPKSEMPIVWRGPLKTRLILEFLANVEWGRLDYLIVDLPPGTGDEALTIAQFLKGTNGAIVVTTPSDLAGFVVKKAIMFCKEVGFPVLGIVENMSEFICPNCGAKYTIFGKGSGRRIAEEMQVRYLGSIPLDPRINECNDKGEPFILKFPESEAARKIYSIAEKIIQILEGQYKRE